MLLLLMSFYIVFLSIESMLDLMLSLMERHHMMMGWLIKLSDKSDIFRLDLVVRLWVFLHFNIKFIWMAISIRSRLYVSFWYLMMVNVWLHVSHSVVNYLGLGLFFWGTSLYIMHWHRSKHKRLIYDFELCMLHNRLWLMIHMSTFNLIMFCVCVLANVRCYQSLNNWMRMYVRMDFIIMVAWSELNLMMVMIGAPFFFKDLSLFIMVNRLNKVWPKISLSLWHNMMMMMLML